MKTKERKQYTAEFKAQAVALMATGKPIGQFAKVVGSPRSAFANQSRHQAIIDYAIGEIHRVLET